MSRVRKAVLGTLVAVALSAVVTSSASAYGHTWACNGAPSAYKCYDNQGTIYNPWVEVDVHIYAGNVPELCAKAEGSGGGIKAGSGCDYNSAYRLSNLAASPSSWGYVYWGGSAASNNLGAHAST